MQTSQTVLIVWLQLEEDRVHWVVVIYTSRTRQYLTLCLDRNAEILVALHLGVRTREMKIPKTQPVALTRIPGFPLYPEVTFHQHLLGRCQRAAWFLWALWPSALLKPKLSTHRASIQWLSLQPSTMEDMGLQNRGTVALELTPTSSKCRLLNRWRFCEAVIHWSYCIKY